ncbi:MAG TPA: potassium channel protein [Candidatus Acidoferrales bacterium]|nr:potassium channel protein [Candidatus Acidoferrales bacterium]
MRPFRRVRVVVGMVAGLLAIGTLGFRLIQHWSWFEAFYATLMTVSTIGAEPENQLSHAGRVFNVALIFLGIAVIGYAIGVLTHGVIESELGRFFGRRRMEKEIAHLRDHFVICGAGRVGRRLAAEVSARGLPLVIIERESERARWAEQRNLPVILGDASNEAILRQARIEHARGLASAVTTDAQNVYIVLTARSLSPNLFIVARASEEDAESKLLTAGANLVVSPYLYAGQRMARLLTRPHVQKFLDLAMSSLGSELDLQIEEISVGDHSRLAGLRLGEADLRRRIGVLLLAIRRKTGKIEFNPGADAAIESGDFLIAMGETQQLKELESLAGVV